MTASMCPINPQRGIATLWAIIFIIVGVMITLMQVHDIAGSRGVATMQQSDSTAALFIAESGLERGIATVLNSSSTQCTTATPISHPVGNGEFELTGNCINQGAMVCSTCELTSTGYIPNKVNATASRTLKATLKVKAADEGAICNSALATCTNTVPANCPGATCTWEPDWSFTLANTTGFDALALFNLAAKRQAADSGSICPPAYDGDPDNLGCQMLWNLDAQNGANSIGNMGNAVPIGAGKSATIFQSLTGDNFSVAEVGVLFTGSSGTPALIPSGGYHAYWYQTTAGQPNSDGLGTGGKKNTFQGGVVIGSDDTTSVPPATSCQANDTATLTDLYLNASTSTPNKQLDGCTSWCYGGDTLVMGISLAPDGGTLTSLPYTESANSFSSSTLNERVWFNTAGGYAPDGTHGSTIPMKRIISYPIQSGIADQTNFPTDVVSEIWYAHNPQYQSSADVHSGAKFYAYAGATGTALFSGTIRRSTGSGNSYYLTIHHITHGTVAAGTNYKIASLSGFPVTNGAATPTYSLLNFSVAPNTGTLPTAEIDVSSSISNIANLASILAKGATMSFSFGEPSQTLTVTGMSSYSPNISLGDALYNPALYNATSSPTPLPIAMIDSGGSGSYILVDPPSPPTPLPSTTGWLIADQYWDGSSLQSVTLLSIGTSNRSILTSPSGAGGLPSGDALSSNILLAKKSGMGKLQANTSINTLGATAYSYTIDQPPAYPLNNANICGGTCAFFDHSSTGTRTTAFTIPDRTTPNLDYYWAAGFICLSGANQLPQIVKSRTQVLSKTWTEVVK